MDHPAPLPYHSSTISECANALRTSSTGLSDKEAAARLTRYGANTLQGKPPKSLFAMLKEQLTDPMVLILIGASLLSLILGEWIEGIVIGIIVMLNAVIGILQERKAQSAMEALRQMGAPTARVLREGEESVIPAAQVVPGDVVLLRDGDAVPADLRLIDSANLKIQEASLTGESVPSEKDTDAVLSEDAPIGDRTNMAYASSIVMYGRGTGIVTATGMHTEVGRIARMLDDQESLDTPLKRKLTVLGQTLTKIGIAVCILIFIIGLLYGQPLIPQFLIAIALAISIIPEGLPATATIVMALGVQRMARKNALIRRLPAVETLGSATVICSDKTGTLTENRMTVVEVAVNGDFEKGQGLPLETAASTHPDVYKELVQAAALCNDASFDPDRPGEIIGDPTEGALIYMARSFGLSHEALEDDHPRLYEEPFDSNRKRMTTVHAIDGTIVAYTKGATESVLPLCTHRLTASGVRPMTDEDRRLIAALSQEMSSRALRVLGFAMRHLDAVPDDDGASIENHLTFIGLAGMIDPPREEVAASIRTCKEAGIRTIMITGDHKTTALAIAQHLGIAKPGDRAISGDELMRMTDDELDAVIFKISVFARVSPADKLRLIESLKRTGEIAAMTGDGVNDSPALKAAHIGVAMGITGTDVAKESADMILLDDKFTTISHAIKEGRRVYQNIQKVIQFLLSGNAAEVLTLFIATLLNTPAPLLAVHILWVNLATATLPALALGVDPADRYSMKRKPITSGTLFERTMIHRVLAQGFITALLTTAAYWIGAMESHTAGQTMAFSVLALTQLLRALSARSNTQPIWDRAEGLNPSLIAALFVSLALMGAVLLLPPLQSMFSVTDLSQSQWLTILGLSLLALVPTELSKQWSLWKQEKEILE